VEANIHVVGSCVETIGLVSDGSCVTSLLGFSLLSTATKNLPFYQIENRLETCKLNHVHA
jgi:hypothetical protein